ncbi:hypothetical protein JFV29_14140 [Peribacillus sp. TH16]|uniref:hypothetical protein n=1 Tax=Peribacillus sp. TH16 TaxID=2798482 RepID=UPI001912C7DC|nr:hypothetical protein [Peribacillus sp. TH16]MBK5483010.1 hypothetical protein [Peribacillus sp. TH16]
MKMWLAKQKAKAELLKAFRNGEIGNHYSYSSNSGLIYPKIHSVQFDNKKKTLMYVFTLPTGMDPKEVMKKNIALNRYSGNE